MLIKNATPFAHGTTRTSRRPPRPEMVLIVRGKFLIQPGAVTLPEGIPAVAQGSITGDVFADDDDDHTGELLHPSDLAEYKRNAEVMLRGTCHAPGGKPVTECPVRFAVGAWSKLLRVVGRRVWTESILGSKIGDPAPFTGMPLGWAQSFGGPGHAPNPVGKGLGTPELPNVESPGVPILSRSDRPAPAGFGPLSPHWQERRAKIGKARHKPSGEKGSPYYGDDFDWTYFHAAPADQQLPGYLRGDEEVVFQNLHATLPVLTTRLPGHRVRAFVKDVEQRFREVPMHLDTLFADLDKGFLYLTWRGVEPVREFDLLDVKTVLFASEPLSAAPLPIEHHREALEAFERDPKRLDEVLPEDQRKEVERAMATAEAARKGGAAGAGQDALSAALEKLGHLDPRTRDHLRQSLAALMARSARQGLPLQDHVQKALARAGTGAASSGAPGGLKNALRAFHANMEALRRAGGPGSEILAAQEKLLSDPRLAALGVPEGPPRPPPEPAPGADLSGEDLTGRDLCGRDLTGANLERAILTKANLKDARLAGARLKQAVLSEADLTGADLAGADLTEALLIEARAPRANLSGANLTRTIFHEADLEGANLSEAKGESPVFSKARLSGVNGQRARFVKPAASEATLEGADFSGAELTSGVFARCQARGLQLTGATLSKMSFFGSDLSRASLADARGDQVAFLEADVTGADFEYAVFPGSLWNQATAVSARFFGANLKQGKFYRTILDRAVMAKANLYEANFTKASITGTLFTGANLFDARFVMATGTGHDFTEANLGRAFLEIDDARG